MKTRTKCLVLIYVAVVCAALMLLRDVFEPEVVREAAVAQMHSSDEAVQKHRAFDRAKHALDWAWVAIPVAGVVLFRRELRQLIANRADAAR
jgi:hypothetical protein